LQLERARSTSAPQSLCVDQQACTGYMLPIPQLRLRWVDISIVVTLGQMLIFSPPQINPARISPLAARVTFLPVSVTLPTKSHPRTAPSLNASESRDCTTTRQAQLYAGIIHIAKLTISRVLSRVRYLYQRLVIGRLGDLYGLKNQYRFTSVFATALDLCTYLFRHLQTRSGPVIVVFATI
jgi:hypothetical protein